MVSVMALNEHMETIERTGKVVANIKQRSLT